MCGCGVYVCVGVCVLGVPNLCLDVSARCPSSVRVGGGGASVGGYM